MVNLGDKAKDTITGLQGVVVAITEYLYGCRRVTLEPIKLKPDGSLADGWIIDEQRLKVLKAGFIKPETFDDYEPKTELGKRMSKPGGPRVMVPRSKL